MGCLLHKLVCSVSYAGAEHLVLYLYRCYDADLGAIGNKLHRMPKVSKVCLRCVCVCASALVVLPSVLILILPISRHLDEDSYSLPRVCITPFEGGCCYHDRHQCYMLPGKALDTDLSMLQAMSGTWAGHMFSWTRPGL